MFIIDKNVRRKRIDGYTKTVNGKEIKVDSYLRKPVDVKKKSSSAFKSYYSGKDVGKKELLQVDKTIGRMDGEDREFLMDEFPKSKNPRKKPFVHKSDLGYDVLNISKKDLEKAMKNF